MSNIQKTSYANYSSFGGEETKLLCQLTNRIQKWKKKTIKSVVFVCGCCQLKHNMYKTLIHHFNVEFCVFSGDVQLDQGLNSLVMMTGGASTPLQSTGGRHTTMGRLHRHTAFTQLPYGIATDRHLRTAGLLPEYQKKSSRRDYVHCGSNCAQSNSVTIKRRKAGDSRV